MKRRFSSLVSASSRPLPQSRFLQVPLFFRRVGAALRILARAKAEVLGLEAFLPSFLFKFLRKTSLKVLLKTSPKFRGQGRRGIKQPV